MGKNLDQQYLLLVRASTDRMASYNVLLRAVFGPKSHHAPSDKLLVLLSNGGVTGVPSETVS